MEIRTFVRQMPGEKFDEFSSFANNAPGPPGRLSTRFALRRARVADTLARQRFCRPQAMSKRCSDRASNGCPGPMEIRTFVRLIGRPEGKNAA
jgi:hypothetical protein